MHNSVVFELGGGGGELHGFETAIMLEVILFSTQAVNTYKSLLKPYMEGSVILIGASVCNGEHIGRLLENGGFLYTLLPISFTWRPRNEAKGKG